SSVGRPKPLNASPYIRFLKPSPPPKEFARGSKQLHGGILVRPCDRKNKTRRKGNGIRGNSPVRYGISFGAPVSLSSYIGNAGDGRNWKERLDASLKTFNVPW